MADNCTTCTDCNTPVVPEPCATPLYTANTCPDVIPTDCVSYLGADQPCLGIYPSGPVPLTLTGLLTKLFTYVSTLLGRVTSSSLSITQSGACGDVLDVEIIPSSQAGNKFTLGNDGKPYVPTVVTTLLPSKCISWQQAVTGNSTTWVPIIDFTCVSANTTIQAIACIAPSGITVSAITQTTAQVSWTVAAGVTYDILINNAVAYTTVSSPATVSNLAAGTNYSLAVRINCSGGSKSETTTAFNTLANLVCNTPTNLQITSI